MEMFADQHSYPLGTCDMNRGDCDMMSNVLADWLETVSMPEGWEEMQTDLHKATLLQCDGFKGKVGRDANPLWQSLPPGSLNHVVVKVGKWILDMTGAQFGAKYADPIYPLSTLKRNWTSVRSVSRANRDINNLRRMMLQSGAWG